MDKPSWGRSAELGVTGLCAVVAVWCLSPNGSKKHTRAACATAVCYYCNIKALNDLLERGGGFGAGGVRGAIRADVDVASPAVRKALL